MRKFIFILLVVQIIGILSKTDDGVTIEDVNSELAGHHDPTLNRFSSNVIGARNLKNPRPVPPKVPEEKQMGKEIDENIEIVEGDILVEKASRQKRKIINDYDPSIKTFTRWPNKIVPYEIDDSMSQEMLRRINIAINHWHKFTCIRFEPYNSIRHKFYRSKLYFVPSTICGSFVGYRSDQIMYVSYVYLSLDCSTGSVIHELGHAIGFRHEQSRTDRNSHVSINYNMIGDDLKSQYDIMPSSNTNYYNVPYDLFSIMHYSNQGGVITALDQRRNFLMGQRSGLSFLDIKLANLAYSCSENCDSSLKCQNDGFVDQNCQCYCPEGFSGDNCESLILKEKYNDVQISREESFQNLDCTFINESYCAWSRDTLRGVEDFVFNKPEFNGITETQKYFSALDPNFKTGPQFGDRFNNTAGTYIYLNSLRKTTPGGNGILSSPKISVSVPVKGCLEFYYHMYQGTGQKKSYPLNVGNLSVNIRYADGSTKMFWIANGTQGPNWNYGRVSLELLPPASMIYFETLLVGYSYGDIALDDITFKDEECDTMMPDTNQEINNNKQKFAGDWSVWSACSLTCGNGVQTRRRNCNGVADCTPTESRSCKIADCPDNVGWSEWTPWSKCSATCGRGYHYRVRACRSRDTSLCVGKPVEYETCEIMKCPMKDSSKLKDVLKSILNEWTEWSECIGTCDYATQKRSRLCSGLANCGQSGVEEEVRPCSLSNCSIALDERTMCGGQYFIRRGQTIMINSPNYPYQYPTNIKCHYYIRTVPGSKVNVQILDIDLEESRKNTCIDGIELRYYSLGQPGPIYCGESQSVSETVTINGYNDKFLIIFRSNWGQARQRRGFSFQATAV